MCIIHHVTRIKVKKRLAFWVVCFLCVTLSWNNQSAEATEKTGVPPGDIIKGQEAQGGDARDILPPFTPSSYPTPRKMRSKVEPQWAQKRRDISKGGANQFAQPDRSTDRAGYPKPIETQLFRPHSPKYYPPKDSRTAILFSAMLPGSGQTYAGKPGKGLVFFFTTIGLLSSAGFNLDRAAHYDDLADRFVTGFYDPHSSNFLTADQAHVKAGGHAKLGVIFLATGIGIHIWNIFDAAETVEQYNERRFPAQVQQTIDGDTFLTVTQRF
jgi:TM2 domain-containing membrane protein YozV